MPVLSFQVKENKRKDRGKGWERKEAKESTGKENGKVYVKKKYIKREWKKGHKGAECMKKKKI